MRTDYVHRKHYSAVLAGAWCSHNLNERFREALRKARSELGRDGKFGAVLKRAWALDPELRELFGDAVSSGLRKMWANAALRAEQSARVKSTYTPALRRLRSEALRKNWSSADFRAKMLGSSSRLPNGRFGARGSV